MAARLANMVPLHVLARDICDNFGDSDGKYYGEHLKNIINVYKFMYMNMMSNIQVKSVQLSPQNIMDLPNDFVRETKIGIINQWGRIAVMTLDRNLRAAPVCNSFDDVDDALSCIDTDDDSDAYLNGLEATFYPFYNYTDIDGQYWANVMGYGGTLNYLGYFNIDREQGVLIVSSNLPANCSIIMEYKSDGVSAGLELIPTELVDAIVKGAKARFCLDKKDSRYAEYENLHQVAYKIAKRLYIARPIDTYARLFKTS